MLAGGRARLVFCVALMGLAVSSACGGGDEEESDRAGALDPLGDPGTETTSTTGERGLALRDYDVGDCVYWDLDMPADGPYGYTASEVVRCTETHYIQISAEETAPEQGPYPTDEQWDTFVDGVCRGHAQVLLGAPLDPYGRFGPAALQPSPESWGEGDRRVWCGVGLAGAGPDVSGWAPMAEDLRGADQSYHWEVGQCVAYPPAALVKQAVPCDQPHQMEITGRVEYADQSGLPAAGAADPRCEEPGRAFMGGPAPEPWGFGSEILAPESWAAGVRFAYCFAGQWNPDGSGLAVISASIRG